MSAHFPEIEGLVNFLAEHREQLSAPDNVVASAVSTDNGLWWFFGETGISVSNGEYVMTFTEKSVSIIYRQRVTSHYWEDISMMNHEVLTLLSQASSILLAELQKWMAQSEEEVEAVVPVSDSQSSQSPNQLDQNYYPKDTAYAFRGTIPDNYDPITAVFHRDLLAYYPVDNQTNATANMRDLTKAAKMIVWYLNIGWMRHSKVVMFSPEQLKQLAELDAAEVEQQILAVIGNALHRVRVIRPFLETVKLYCRVNNIL